MPTLFLAEIPRKHLPKPPTRHRRTRSTAQKSPHVRQVSVNCLQIGESSERHPKHGPGLQTRDTTNTQVKNFTRKERRTHQQTQNIAIQRHHHKRWSPRATPHQANARTAVSAPRPFKTQQGQRQSHPHRPNEQQSLTPPRRTYDDEYNEQSDTNVANHTPTTREPLPHHPAVVSLTQISSRFSETSTHLVRRTNQPVTDHESSCRI